MYNIHPAIGLPVDGAEPVKSFARDRHYLYVGLHSVGGVLKAFGFIMPTEEEIKARLKQQEKSVKLPAMPINQYVKYIRTIGTPPSEKTIIHIKPRIPVLEEDIPRVLDYPADITPFAWVYKRRRSGLGVVALESKQLKIPIEHEHKPGQKLVFQASSAQVALASLRILSMHSIMAKN